MSLLAGPAVVAAAYLLARRWGVWRVLALAAAAPAVLTVGGPQAPAHAAGPVLLAAGLLLVGVRGVAPVVAGVAGVAAGLLLAVVHPVAGDLDWEYAAATLAVLAAAGLGRSASVPWRVASGVLAVVPAVPLLAGDVRTAHLWWPVAGAIGLTALLRGRRGRGAARTQVDAVDEAALAEFDERYGTPRLAPVAVVIAAYAEEDGLPAVLAGMPAEVLGLPLDVLVVDDGSPDRTAEVAAAGGAHVVRCGTNRGQGAALRLGYRVAREHGAAYVVTTDADGQYDIGDLPAVLGPVVEGRADFVTGSRVLGHQPVQDPLRRLGVHVFAWTVSALTGHRVTDTSFGMRAMRVAVTEAVTLNQPQYQSSELLIGTLSHGFRVLEVPGTMHRRSAGTTKKGRNLVYGRRYAGVVLGTWWREGCPRPVGGETAQRGTRATPSTD